MSDENLAVVRAFYAALARERAPVELLSADVEYVNPDGAVEPGTRHGTDAFLTAGAKVSEGWESWQMEPEQLIALGNQVAVVVRYRARGRSSGLELEGRESALFTVCDGKITRYAWFQGVDDALTAAESST